MRNLKTVEKKVRAILEKNEDARNDDMVLYLALCNVCLKDAGAIPLAVDKKEQYPFLVCYCDYHNPLSAAWATEGVASDDYLEAMEIFTERVQSQIDRTRAELSKFPFDKAVFTKEYCIPDDHKGRRNTLKYYFDVSDTHEGYYGSRPVPIWQMNEQYEQAVMERLSDRFGEVEGSDLASVLMETAKNAVEDNLPDYFSQLKDCTKDSFLEELDDFNVEVIYKRLAANSVAFMLISRCGLDTGEFFDREDFQDIINFNTPATINALGIATSDIAEMALREISLTIRDVQMAEKTQNRTFVPKPQARYDIGREQPERSKYNERNHLHQTGRLSYSRPDISDRARASAWQIRFDAQGLSGAAQESDLQAAWWRSLPQREQWTRQVQRCVSISPREPSCSEQSGFPITL